MKSSYLTVALIAAGLLIAAPVFAQTDADKQHTQSLSHSDVSKQKAQSMAHEDPRAQKAQSMAHPDVSKQAAQSFSHSDGGLAEGVTKQH
jgi:Flp pilus assembly protein TadB